MSQTVTVVPELSTYAAYEVWWQEHTLLGVSVRRGSAFADDDWLYIDVSGEVGTPASEAVRLIAADAWPDGSKADVVDAALMLGGFDLLNGLEALGDVTSTLPGGRRFVPLPEAADRLSISERRLRDYCREGRIQHRRRDGRYSLLWPDDFDAFVEATLVEN